MCIQNKEHVLGQLLRWNYGIQLLLTGFVVRRHVLCLNDATVCAQFIANEELNEKRLFCLPCLTCLCFLDLILPKPCMNCLLDSDYCVIEPFPELD